MDCQANITKKFGKKISAFSGKFLDFFSKVKVSGNLKQNKPLLLL
jgi:hypothetical protein